MTFANPPWSGSSQRYGTSSPMDMTGSGSRTIRSPWIRNISRNSVKKRSAEGFTFTWTCLSRVDRLDEEIVGLMKDAGCVRVHLGLESGNDETLRLMGKRVSVRDGIEAVRLFRQAGIETAGFFIVGYPGETEESIDQTLALAVSLPLDEISINVPFPLPGSPLFSRVAAVDTTADWKIANEVSFIYRVRVRRSMVTGTDRTGKGGIREEEGR